MNLLSPHEGLARIAAHVRASSRPFVAIIGPTACGKTAYSLQVAAYVQREEDRQCMVVNADSRQLYRYLTIGTAKITPEEMQQVPHALIDVLDPDEELSVASYKERADRVVEECFAQNLVPLLTGGSMLYVRAMTDGLEPLPPSDPALRARIAAEWDADDGWTLYERLQRVDPTTAASFERQNKVYVVRAMELWEMTGKPPSLLKKTIPPSYDVLQIGLWRSREDTVERIRGRVDSMLANGWVEEVEGLLDKGYGPDDPAMKSHGYKEIMQWLLTDERDRIALAEMITRKTCAYAKRQMTWWKSDERIVWIDAALASGN